MIAWALFVHPLRLTFASLLWLLPPLKRDEYAWAKGSVDEHRLFFWFDPLPDAGGYRLRQGMTKTHEVWIGVDGSTPPCDRPLFPACTPRWAWISAARRQSRLPSPSWPS